MNTAPLQNPAALLQNPPPPAKQNNASAAPTPFKQVLSQEVEQRRDGANVADSTDRAAAAKPAAAAGNTGTDAEAKAATDSSDSVAGVDGAASDNPAMAAVAAERLALVAGLQHGADAAKSADTALASAADTAPASGKAAGSDAMIRLAAGPALLPARDAALAAASGKVELAAEVAGSAAPTAKDAALAQESRFGATLEQAATAKPAIDAALLKNLEKPETSLPPAIAQLAAAVAPAAQTPGTPAADKLTPQVGTPAWDAALGQKVVWMVAGGQQSASLTLNPPDLGPLQVVLHVSNSHANASFISAQPEVRQALEAAMPRLREMLGDAGIQLGQANVGSGMPNQQQPGEPASRSAARDGTPATVGRDTALPPVRAERISSGRGMVDTFA
jgi:flagellar hook-length control protein FliK